MQDSLINGVFDTDYTGYVPDGGYPLLPAGKQSDHRWDRIVKARSAMIFSTPKKSGDAKPKADAKTVAKQPLATQIQTLLALPDDEYSDSLLTSEMRKYILDTERQYAATLSSYKSHIAPSYWQVEWSKMHISWMLCKSYYVHDFPSYVEALWTREVIGFGWKFDRSYFLYKNDNSSIQTTMRAKATMIKAEINEAMRKGITLDSELELRYRDIEMIRQKLATHEESYFELGMYLTIYHEEHDKLTELGKRLEQVFSWIGILIKPAIQRMDEWFNSTLWLCKDDMGVTRSAITSSVAGSFPFVSSDVMTKTGILYGINLHTWSLVIFDRFNADLPNMNSIVLATSWAGKSFTVKLEIMRYMMNGIHVMVIDPENEYKALCEKLGGTYISLSTSSTDYINPFDLPPKIDDRDYWPGDLLRGKILDLLWLIKILVGWLDAMEEALLDKALQLTYQLKGISLQDEDPTGKEMPRMVDLYNVLDGMDGWEHIAMKLSKFVTWSFANIFNNFTTIDVTNQLTVFCIRDLEDVLKTPAMYNILNYVWTKVRAQKRKRLLVCDEAWIMLQNDISANFLFGLIKRARKYWLGITTISQDIEDFMRSQYGKPILSNSPFQLLLKQSTTSMKVLSDMLGLSEAEKHRLVSAWVGEGLMFAGNQHVAVKILASPWEKEFLTTDV